MIFREVNGEEMERAVDAFIRGYVLSSGCTSNSIKLCLDMHTANLPHVEGDIIVDGLKLYVRLPY